MSGPTQFNTLPIMLTDLITKLYLYTCCTGGVRANIIHYIANNQVINDGELVLMDAGCEFHGYTSDLTRTWPVSGKGKCTYSNINFIFCISFI